MKGSACNDGSLDFFAVEGVPELGSAFGVGGEIVHACNCSVRSSVVPLRTGRGC